MTADTIWREAFQAANIGDLGPEKKAISFQGFGDSCHPILWNEARKVSVMELASNVLDDLTALQNHNNLRAFSSNAFNDCIQQILSGENDAIIPFYNLEDLRNARPKNVIKWKPHLLSIQYISKDKMLHCVATLRDSNVWDEMPQHLCTLMFMHLMMCEVTDLHPGAFWFNTGIIHMDDNIKVLEKDLMEQDHGQPLKLNLNSHRPTSRGLKGIRLDAINIDAGKGYKGQESIFAKHYGPFSIATTLLTLKSLSRYDTLETSQAIELVEFVDPRLIYSAQRYIEDLGNAKHESQ